MDNYMEIICLNINCSLIIFRSLRNERNYGNLGGRHCVLMSHRTDGAASGESCLHELSRVVFEANGDQTGKMTRCHFVRRRGEGQYSARGSKTKSQ